jgi:hypothetical protein
MDSQTRNQITQLLKAGQRAEAQGLLAEVIRQYPHDEEAWLGMASLVKDPTQKRECLSRVLSINPKNKQARELLARLSAGTDADGASRPSLKRPGGGRARRRPVPMWMWYTLLGAGAFALLVFTCGGLWRAGVFDAFLPPSATPVTPTSTFPTPLPSFTPTPVTPTATLFRLPTMTSSPPATETPAETATPGTPSP